MKQVYNKKHLTFVTQFKVGHPVNVFYVEYDEALDQQGIHLTEGAYEISLDSSKMQDALETAERDGFRAIFIHKKPSNVTYLSNYRKAI